MKTSKKILIVDDDIDVINIVKTILDNQGYTVLTANNKTEGLKKAKEEKPDLAILDVMMSSHFEGFELAEELTKSEEFKNMPVLMQTSIEVLETNDPDVIGLAKSYRANTENKDLDVLLIEEKKTGKAGIDYRNENGIAIWLPVDGFIRKPVKAKVLIESIEKFLQ
ncbi:MAG: response regulator [Bacteroidales bacterium]|nr:response regulator [Bacteroidales bacterium]MBN2755776.1 response regulator [Bacteroidales bacterium]